MKKRFAVLLVLLIALTLLPLSLRTASAEATGGDSLNGLFDASIGKMSITEQPKAVTVKKGANATFKVKATGATGYQWQYSKNNGASWTNWSGKTSNSLTVTGSATNNGCFYRCLVKSNTESKYSGWARLTVSDVKPMVLTQPANVTTTLGKSATFKVVVGGTGKTYQWQYSKNNGASWTNWSGKTSNSLTVTGSATNNGCLYRCVVKNSYGTVWSKCARLTVSNAKPMILTQPKAQTVSLGNSVTFKVAAGGLGLKYQWYYSKNNGASWTKWNGKTSAGITVKASATNNGCRYRCVVKNSYGSVTSASARLTSVGIWEAIDASGLCSFLDMTYREVRSKAGTLLSAGNHYGEHDYMLYPFHFKNMPDYTFAFDTDFADAYDDGLDFFEENYPGSVTEQYLDGSERCIEVLVWDLSVLGFDGKIRASDIGAEIAMASNEEGDWCARVAHGSYWFVFHCDGNGWIDGKSWCTVRNAD